MSALTRIHTPTGFLIAIAVCSVALAQQPKAPRATPSPTTPKRTTAAAEDPQKAEILNSPKWQQMVHEFSEWLSVQRIYPKSQIPQLKARFREKVQKSSAAELQAWIAEMDQKLQVVMSPEARDAREWLGHFVSAKVVLPEADIKKFDIVNASTEQLQEALDEVEQRKASLGSATQQFNRTRQQQIQRFEKQQDEQQSAMRQEYTNRTLDSYYPGYQSQYAPRRINYPPLDRGPSMWISPWGGVGIGIN